jgi:hypothetical protein
MLSGLTKAFRWRAACTLALLYGLCVLAPAVAFAFGDPARTFHCLTEDHHSAASLHADHHHGSKAHADHVHQDGTHHQHAKHEGGDGKTSPAKCCGFACLSALPAGFADLISAPIVHAVILPARHDSVAGRGPDLRYRPPISLLSL